MTRLRANELNQGLRYLFLKKRATVDGFAQAAQINSSTAHKKLTNPQLFLLRELVVLSGYLQIDIRDIFTIIVECGASEKESLKDVA